ncbi:MAG: FHA domain-containing protein, partial [Kiritimatiellaeota bacterium]|nr:FHA domain-containing protein [Kiritimatiellota bacterium]
MTHTLHITNPALPPAQFDLPPGEYLIGRGDACAIRLRAGEISERHARLTLTAHGATVEDLQSANGTYLNASPLTRPTPLASGARLTVGPYTLVLCPKEKPAAPTPQIQNTEQGTQNSQK